MMENRQGVKMLIKNRQEAKTMIENGKRETLSANQHLVKFMKIKIFFFYFFSESLFLQLQISITLNTSLQMKLLTTTQMITHFRLLPKKITKSSYNMLKTILKYKFYATLNNFISLTLKGKHNYLT